MLSLSVIGSSLLEDLRKEYLEISNVEELRESLKGGETIKPGFAVQGDVILFNGRIYVDPTSKLIPTILREFHASKVGGHTGIEKTLKRIHQTFYWDKMAASIRDFVTTYLTCQRIKIPT